MGLVEELSHGERRGRASQEADGDQESLGPDGARGCGVEMGAPGLGAFSPSLVQAWQCGTVPAIATPGISVPKACAQRPRRRWWLAGCDKG